MLGKYKNIHMMGVGGIGMSGIAQMLLEKGVYVSGCDAASNVLTEKLAEMGMSFSAGHNAEHMNKNIDLIVRSSAVSEDHPELHAARKLSIPIWKRAQMLALLTQGRQCLAVTGTHGKTTTSFMITQILEKAGLDPSFVIGGEIPALGGNARWGKGGYFIIEADESDGTQSYYLPETAVLTNIDRDHLEFYSGIPHITETMKNFVKNIPKDGVVIGWGEDPAIAQILNGVGREAISFGLNPLQDIYAANVFLNGWHSQFDVIYKKKILDTITVNVPGEHNVLNALAAIAATLRIGISIDNIKAGLAEFYGVKRRMDAVYKDEAVSIINDYAHHPNEIKAVLDTIRRAKIAKGRIVAVFQPHRFTRTKFLHNEFAASFKSADMIFLTNIYSAGEPEISGINGKLIYNEVVKKNKAKVFYGESIAELSSLILKKVVKGDTIVIMGAGNITNLAYILKEHYMQKAGREAHSTERIGQSVNAAGRR